MKVDCGAEIVKLSVVGGIFHYWIYAEVKIYIVLVAVHNLNAEKLKT